MSPFVEKLPTLDELRAIGRNVRLHGNKFIQIDLPMGDRLHFWGDHIPIAQEYPTQIHDHAYSFHSHIVAGALINTLYVVSEDSSAESVWKHAWKPAYYALTYHQLVARPRVASDTELVRLDDRQYSARPLMPKLYEIGQDYDCAWGVFHTSAPVGYAITHMVKTEEHRHQPRILCPIHANPDNNFQRYKYSESALWDCVEQILKIAEVTRGPG